MNRSIDMVTRSEVLEIPTRIDAARMPVRDVLAFVRRMFAEWLQRSRSRDELAGLSERQRLDVGLTLEQVEVEIRKPFWRA
jgi:uncharacterized protein YjiS (DUF1127 family)